MPAAGYLSVTGIESCLQYFAATYPAICQLTVLPETSIEGRTIRAVRIASGGGADRRGILFIAGVHARELVNPDLVLSFALRLCKAYTTNAGLSFGGRSYSASIVRLIVDSLDIFILPLVNPDGRTHVQSPTGNAMWRKNRNPNAGLPCKGVDLNRNFDFLWSSGIGTSSNSCSDIFKGSAAFSEFETRNVRHLLDAYSNIGFFIDIHSYSELVLYPWGDDNNQTATPSMNFQNPAYNGLRGTPGDSIYQEYIPSADLDWYMSTGNRLRDAVAAVRGRIYTVEQSIGLYPTSGTSDDYAYARHYVDASRRKVLGLTLETAAEFQPPYAEALNVIAEISAGLIEFCLASLCAVEEMARGFALAKELMEVRVFRDEESRRYAAGREYLKLLEANTVEILEVVSRDEKLRSRLARLLRDVTDVVRSRRDTKPQAFEPEIIDAVEEALRDVAAVSSDAFKRDIELVRRDLDHFRGQTVLKGLELASRSRS